MMHGFARHTLPVALACLAYACATNGLARPVPCSPEWFSAVEAELDSTDGMGHGPDVGSDEWRSVVEFRLGIRGQSGIPPRQSDAWCRYIEDELTERSIE